MANIPEFISVLRRIRDVIYPRVEAIYENTAILESQAKQSKNAAEESAAPRETLAIGEIDVTASVNVSFALE